MTNEELQRQFFDRDGLWSDVTGKAKARFKTDCVELDANWAGTPTWWTCPGCHRDKANIFRLSKGVLLARLDWHHDHLEDRLKVMLKAKFGDRWVDRVLPSTGRLQDRLNAMIARFEPGFVCIDCNNVDGMVKAKWKDISQWLSFSPREISSIIKVRPNAEHEIDFEAARSLYATILPKIAARESLLSHIVEMIETGDLDQESAAAPPSHRGDILRQHVIRGFVESTARYEIEEDIANFEGRSLSRDAAANAKAKMHRAFVEAPTPEEVEAYDGGGEADGLWLETPKDWRCPGCARNRMEVLRRSKNRTRKWSGKMLRHTEYVRTQTYDEEEGTHDEKVDHEVTHVICSDCASIASEVKRRNADLSTGNLLLQLRDMKAVLTAKPNQAHEVDWSAAAQRLRQSEWLRYLIACYQTDRMAALDCFARYNEAFEHCGKDTAKTKEFMIDGWVRVYRLSKDAAEARIRYLLKRATYLNKADTGQDLKNIRNRRQAPTPVNS
jgi:rubredoxin